MFMVAVETQKREDADVSRWFMLACFFEVLEKGGGGVWGSWRDNARILAGVLEIQVHRRKVEGGSDDRREIAES